MLSQYLNPINKKRAEELFLILSITILIIIFSFLLIKDIQSAHQIRIAQKNNAFYKQKNTKQIAATDVDYIQSWMTFHYINTIFAIPENYLNNNLKINDNHYPNLTIKKYAKNNNLNEQSALATLKQSVRDFMANNKAN